MTWPDFCVHALAPSPQRPLYTTTEKIDKADAACICPPPSSQGITGPAQIPPTYPIRGKMRPVKVHIKQLIYRAILPETIDRKMFRIRIFLIGLIHEPF